MYIRNTLKVASCNIRSLLPKLDEVKEYTSSKDIDIFHLQESWLSAETETRNYLAPSGYSSIATAPEGSRGGGLISWL